MPRVHLSKKKLTSPILTSLFQFFKSRRVEMSAGYWYWVDCVLLLYVGCCGCSITLTINVYIGCFNQKFLTFLLRLSAYWLFLFETTNSFNAQYSRSGEHPVYRSVVFSIINEHFTNNNLRSAHSTFYQFQDEAKK